MSTTPQGPGWWQASDGNWYPPEQAPGPAPTTPPSAASTPSSPPGAVPTASSAPSGAPTGSTAARRAPTPAEITMMAGGGVCLIFSFLPFYEVSLSGFGSDSTNAWGTGLFPTTTLIALFAVIGGGLAAARGFGVRLPGELLTFTMRQIMLASGFFATLLALSYLVSDHGGVDFGIGYWFMLIGAIAVLVGAVMDLRTAPTGH